MRRSLLPALLTVALLATVLAPSLGASETPGLSEARAEALRLTEELDAAQSRLGELDQEIEAAEARQDELREEMADLQEEVDRWAVEQYLQGPVAPVMGPEATRQMEADALGQIVRRSDGDAIERYRSLAAQTEQTTEELATLRADQEDELATLEQARVDLEAQLLRLEQLERERLEAERRRAEEQARQAAEAAERRAAAERAERLAAEEQAREQGRAEAERAARTPETTGPSAPPPSTSAPTTPPATTPPATTAPAPAPAPSPPSGSILCPVPGSVFRDSWGDPRSGGRRHRGVDMMAPTGTPIFAPASGTVSHGSDAIGGLSFYLNADNGWYMFGTHLVSFGASGRVEAGTVIGYVGETGNAVGSHLHYEIHIGGTAVNPYPYVAAVC